MVVSSVFNIINFLERLWDLSRFPLELGKNDCFLAFWLRSSVELGKNDWKSRCKDRDRKECDYFVLMPTCPHSKTGYIYKILRYTTQYLCCRFKHVHVVKSMKTHGWRTNTKFSVALTIIFTVRSTIEKEWIRGSKCICTISCLNLGDGYMSIHSIILFLYLAEVLQNKSRIFLKSGYFFSCSLKTCNETEEAYKQWFVSWTCLVLYKRQYSWNFSHLSEFPQKWISWI